GDFTAPDRLRSLVSRLTDNGKNNHRFENISLLNTSKWILAGGFPSDCLRFYGYPSADPVYVFIVEENDFKLPHLHVRTPSGGHNSEILDLALKALLDELKPALRKHGKLIFDADTTFRAAFFKLQREGAPFETLYSGDFIPFYMNEGQKREILEKEFTAPDGYEIGKVNVLKDYEFIHRMWPFANFAVDLVTRERLENLPSVCVRDANGDLASWELTHSIGAVTHLFTVEKHRGKGLGVLAENLQAQKLVRQGLHVFKYVVTTNVDVVRGTDRHPLWSRWKALDDDVNDNINQDGKEIMWSFNGFKYTEQ
ncbi:hypothetical protein PENTCL1PPCAC_16019, partial [Pristionchus entomophagus]